MGLSEFLRRLDWEGRALAFAALVRFFTLGQAARLIWNGNVSASELVLERLVWKEALLGRIEDVALPKGCGRGKTPVYFLTRKGAVALSTIAPSLARQARPGRPRGANRARIPHELLVAEAYLWLVERYEVYEFWPESELKRRIGCARATREGRFIKAMDDEATGDFKALVIDHKEDEQERWIHGEIVVRYDARQIEGKPDDVLWFARDPRYADLVEYIKGSSTVLLGDVRAPLDKAPHEAEGLQRNDDSDNQIMLTRLEQCVLIALGRVGGAATAEALALVIGKYRTRTSHTLKRLKAKGKVCSIDAQLVPGRDAGRPMRIYMYAGVRLGSVWEKIRSLIRSLMIVEMATVGYRFFQYESTKDEIEFRDATGSEKPPIIVIVDEPRRMVEHLAERMRAVRSYKIWPLAALQSSERASRLREILTGKIEPTLICNVADAREGRSRKVSDELQKEIVRVVSMAAGKHIEVDRDAIKRLLVSTRRS